MSGLQEIRKKSRKSKIYTKFFFEFGQVIIVNITHPHSDKSQISFSLRVIELYIFGSGGGSSTCGGGKLAAVFREGRSRVKP